MPFSKRLKVGFHNVACSPKSTAVGLCVLALAAARGVHFDQRGCLEMTTKDWFEVGCGVLTAAISAISKDASEPNVRPEPEPDEPGH